MGELSNRASFVEQMQKRGFAEGNPFAAALRCFFCSDTSSTMNAVRSAVDLGAPAEDYKEASFALPERFQALGTVNIVQADEQTSGRGREGRAWHSPRGGLYLSVAFDLGLEPAKLPGFTLAVGVAVLRACAEAGAAGIKLKWPNDLLWIDPHGRIRKAAGILCESFSVQGGGFLVSSGIGLNVSPQQFPDQVPGVGLEEVLRRQIGIEELFASLIDQLLKAALEFKMNGLESIRAQWIKESFFCPGEELKVKRGGETISGIFRGLGPQGELVLVRDGERMLLNAGEVVTLL